jgi:hypothetical protein
MWEIYVVFASPACRAGRVDCAGGINIVGDTLLALIGLLNPYNRNGHKILSIQRLRYNGHNMDIRILTQNACKA